MAGSEPLSGAGAVIAGGSSGIGLATARLLHRDGAHVVVVGRSADRLAQARSAIVGADSGDASRVELVAGDVADFAVVERAAGMAAAAPAGLRVAVAAAGTAGITPILDTTTDDWQPFVETNLYGAFNVVRAAAREMVDGGGAICLVSSNIAAHPTRFGAAYCATKAGVDALVRVAADELGPLHIRVNSVLPGLTETPMVDGIFENSDYIDAITSSTPLSGWSRPDEVAAVIRFLVGPEAGRVTGENIVVDGGQAARATTDFRPIVARRFPDLDPRLFQ